MQTHTKIFLTLYLIAFFSTFTDYSASSQEMWGMTRYGGEYDKGVIFKMDENAENQQVVYSFETIQMPVGGLAEYTDNVFYGLSLWGGRYNQGVLYSFDLENGGFRHILDLDGKNTGSGGMDRMELASNGKFYGTTYSGGEFDLGILFEFDPETERLQKLLDFDGHNYGSRPRGGLIESAGNEIFGTTESGGIHDDGVLFSYNILTGQYTKKYDFRREISGASPVGRIVRSEDGKFYGVTFRGGENDDGVLFSFDPATELVNVEFEFDESVSGKNPKIGLRQTASGTLCGITESGGPSDVGCVYEFNPADHSYNIKPDLLGFEFSENFIVASNNKFYFLSEEHLHVPPSIAIYDAETDEITWGISAGYNTREMSIFYNSLVEASNGKIYFIANSTQNDIRNENVLYEFDKENNQFTNYFKFSGIKTGESPYGSLYQVKNGMLYGTTYIGGNFHQGVVFKIDPSTHLVEKVADFNDQISGAHPAGSVIEADNSRLYGFTSAGGEFDKGVIYELDPHTNTLSKIVDFNGSNGEYPNGDLILAENGMMYGVTSEGGELGFGVFFQVDPYTGEFKKLLDFDGPNLGAHPYINSLVAFPNGLIYGSTRTGGAHDRGILFVFNPFTGILKRVLSFQHDVNGQSPTNCILGNDNKLYYLTGSSTIVRFDPETLAFKNTLLYEDYDTFLNTLTCKLLQAENGKFYAMDRGIIWYRATDFTGGIFEFDMETENVRNVLEFNWQNGSNPEYTTLIQLKNFEEDPVARCKDITLYLDENGQASLEPEDINDGSTGDPVQLSVDKTTFTCEDVGENTVVLTVTGLNGTLSTCEATVTVVDDTPPDIICPINLVTYLDPYAASYILNATYDAVASDNCGIETLAFSVNGSEENENSSIDGYKFPAGSYEVTWTATDRNGNIETCTSELFIEKRPTSVQILINDTDAEGSIMHLEVFLTDNNLERGIEGKTVVFTGEGYYNSAVTNADGVAVIDVELDEGTANGFMLTAEFAGDETYTGSSLEVEVITAIDEIVTLELKVYPIPFAESINFEFTAPVTADARIDVFDLHGRFLENVFNQPVESGRHYRISHTFLNRVGNNLLYNVDFGKYRYTGKLLYKKQ